MKMAKEDITKINCTTTVTILNTFTGKVYKDEAERDEDINNPNTGTTKDHIKQDVLVQVSPKGLNVIQKLMKAQNKNNGKSKA